MVMKRLERSETFQDFVTTHSDMIISEVVGQLELGLGRVRVRIISEVVGPTPER